MLTIICLDKDLGETKEGVFTLKKRKLIVTISIVITSVALILYLLADRYLIEHVEVENALVSSETTNSTTTSSETTTTVDETYEANDLSYTSDTKSIEIEKVVTGSGSDQVVYYVADVQLTDSSSLKSAFANNQFGNNIVQVTSEIASNNNAILAINGDYYGFREDGITIRNGQIFRDNPARTGLAFYEDGSMKIYEETETSAEELIAEGVTQTFSFGPALVENSVAIEDFGDVSIDKNFGNRSIEDSNPRTGVGIHWLTNNLLFSVIGARAISSFINYIINKNIVFNRKKQSHIKPILKYYSLAGFILVSNYLMISLFNDTGNLSLFTSKSFTEGILFMVSYYVQKKFIF